MNPFTQHTVRNSSLAEIEALTQVCEALASFGSTVSLEMLDGYLTALACAGADTATNPHTWLAPLFDDSFDRAFADPASQAPALRALQTRLKVLAEQLNPEALLGNPDEMRLRPLLLSHDAATLEAAIQSGQLKPEEQWMMAPGSDWCAGFMQGSDTCAAPWLGSLEPQAEEVVSEVLAQLEVLLADPASDAYATHLQRFYPEANGAQAPTREDLITQAFFAAQDLRLLAFEQAPKPLTRRVGATLGRNDPCHCGSGKKLKKCHGSAG
jgi:uncharacterized protein